MRPLFEVCPKLDLPWVELADLPTPVERLDLDEGVELYVKRDDLSAEKYGGNKLRTLEPIFGLARAQGAERIFATGAYGSNHALATILHGPRAGLRVGALLFPQPRSTYAAANFRVSLAHGDVRLLRHWSTLPWGMWKAQRDGFVMPPGGATTRGTMGYVSAALELAMQVAAGELPAPRTIVLPVGSTCTSAGLLVGFHLAARRGIGFDTPPRLVAARATPWPVTSAGRIVSLALRSARRLATRVGAPAPERSALAAALRVDGRYLGRGYGHATEAGYAATDRLQAIGDISLDTTYSAKAAAAFLDLARSGADGPILFWSTKNRSILPVVEDQMLANAPDRARRWLDGVTGPVALS